ncbi:NAD(P)H-binding protein [Lichenicola cladoniae]|uniref:NAD(P)H-binding protein n=1 Tax=Lichenicola cladoniae TaxID=1484109 RepID=A0A6M8HLQ3_9PROT|nr:NAD(P)H-binding protein [Lichenicola cladoniae]NPD70155.1 NAD(P)H-binding protein [Acetobacteraceae bacterium]QKE89277.1 NAD(P)H-binding protein [Lichenicola cladoniae]
MYAITGITGQVGSVVADRLLAAGLPVRAVARDPSKAAAWTARGCQLAIADMSDPNALTRAFTDVEGVFILIPPIFDPAPGFPEVRAVVAAVKVALAAARPTRVVCLSTVGAQASNPNLLGQLSLMERELSTLDLSIAFVRAAWFMENASWDIASAKANGIVASFLQPLDRAIPMIATADIGATAARLLGETWSGRRIVELQGPAPVSPNQLARTLGDVLGLPVSAQVVPKSDWHDIFRDQGMSNPEPRMQMIDGFNQGWLSFEGGGGVETERGTSSLETVLRFLADRAP